MKWHIIVLNETGSPGYFLESKFNTATFRSQRLDLNFLCTASLGVRIFHCSKL